MSNSEKLNPEDLNKIVLFDGICNFCNSSMQFIIKHDKTKSLKFATLQSGIGQELVVKYNVSTEIDSVIFIEHNQVFTKSAAALKIAFYFGGIWKLMQLFWIVPVFVRNFFYDIIAKNRYKWFGKREVCMMPSPEIRTRFLEV